MVPLVPSSAVLIRSVTSRTWGLRESPTLIPLAEKIEARKDDTDPFPLLPATCMTLRVFWGSPTLQSSRLMRSRQSAPLSRSAAIPCFS